MFFLISAVAVHGQTSNQSINVVRNVNILSVVYPVKLIFNDSLVKIRNNETLIVHFKTLPTIYKKGFLGKKKEVKFQDSSFLKVKHHFFYPFAYDVVREIKADEYAQRSKRTKRTIDVKLK